MLRSIILPAYNESGYIAEMIAQTIRAAEMRTDPFEVIVVDNASTDETANIVQRLAAADSRISLVRHPENRLYAMSCLTGTKAAKGERIFILDSDGQHPAADIWKFDAKLDAGADFVFGWRVKRAEPPQRIAMSKFLLGLTKFYIGFDKHDVNCGIRGFNRKFADALEIKHRVNFVNPEFFVRAKLANLKIDEAQVEQENRKAGISSHEFGRLWRIFQSVRNTLKSLSEELPR